MKRAARRICEPHVCIAAVTILSAEDLKEIPFIVFPGRVFPLPLTKTITADEPDRPVVDTPLQKIIVDTNRENVGLAAFDDI